MPQRHQAFKLPVAALAVVLLLAGCEIPGLGPDPRIAARVEDGKAIGGACRHAMRGVEDCYHQNESALKTAVFEGWKDMDQYMRDNKIEGILPTVVATHEAAAEEAPEPDKPAKGSQKVAQKSGGHKSESH